MFITRKHITGSSDRGAWPWRPWATAVWCRLARPDALLIALPVLHRAARQAL